MNEYLHAVDKFLPEYFEYRDGGLYYKKSKGRAKRGDEAGSLDTQGRPVVVFCGVRLFVSRVIFFLEHGRWVDIVDHIDGNPANNCIDNLREATASQNSQNHKLKSNNTSGVSGVSWINSLNRWEAYISAEGRKMYLGRFVDKIDAVAARIAAEREHFGEFRRVV